MVANDSDIMSQGEVQSSLQSEEQHQIKNHAYPSLGRQSSIYSLTFDEFQHTHGEGNKNLGSMNMEEFLNSIWSAEEHQTQTQAQEQILTTTPTPSATNTNNNYNIHVETRLCGEDRQKSTKQTSLSRQGSMTLPSPMGRKTVEEVWEDIHKTRKEKQINGGGVSNPRTSSQRQATIGEMTLEDFLVKAGIVREPNHVPPPPPPQAPPQAQSYGMYQNGSPYPRPIMPLSVATSGSSPASALNVVPTGYQTFPQTGLAGGAGGARRGGVYPQQPPVMYGGRVGNGSGAGYGQVVDSPVSPVSSDGICGNQMDQGNPYGLEMGGSRGSRKRYMDGPVEKVVERRQRRMIKNRESAARSRARKQAYTVELEAELNQLKEENAHLKQALQAEIERKRRQQYLEEVKIKSISKSQKAKEKLGAMRRTYSF